MESTDNHINFCQTCKSLRLAEVSGKVDDSCSFISAELYKPSYYVPVNMGIGGGSYIEFKYCLDCGQIQGEFPIPIQCS